MIDFQALCADALEDTAKQLKSEIVNEKVIPKNQGSLETSHQVSHPEKNRAEIFTEKKTKMGFPYGRHLYMHPEYDFNQGDNVNAKGQWFEDWESGGKYQNRPAEIFAERLRQKLGS